MKKVLFRVKIDKKLKNSDNFLFSLIFEKDPKICWGRKLGFKMMLSSHRTQQKILTIPFHAPANMYKVFRSHNVSVKCSNHRFPAK